MTSFNLSGNTGNSFAFDAPGDSVTGSVVDVEEVQQTDLSTGQPACWDNGQPKMMIRVTLATQLKDDAFDDGRRSVYLKGSRKPESHSSLAAVIAAVTASTGGTNIESGGTLTLTYTGDGQPTRKGWNAPKLYEASYTPPKTSMNLAPAPQAPATAPQAPAPQPPTAAPQAPAPAPQAPTQPPALTPEIMAALAAAGVDLPQA